MAQILKENMRNRIIDAAKKELLVYGYKDVSMRRIALVSKMTVGNLYRYFEGKDALIQAIVAPALKKIEESVFQSSNLPIKFLDENLDLGNLPIDLKTIFDQISDGLVEIYFTYPEEMQILMMHSNLNRQLALWFTKLLAKYAFYDLRQVFNHEELMVLASSIASSIFHGVRELLKDHGISKERLKTLLRLYFRYYTSVINTDGKTLLGV